MSLALHCQIRSGGFPLKSDGQFTHPAPRASAQRWRSVARVRGATAPQQLRGSTSVSPMSPSVGTPLLGST